MALTPQENQFLAYRAAGCDILTAWTNAGYRATNGWRKRAAAMDQRLARQVGVEKLAQMVAMQQQKPEALRTLVFGKLTAVAEANILDFLSQEGALDLELIRQAGLGHLIKKLKCDENGKFEIELYSALEATKTLASICGLEQKPRENEQDSDRLRALVEKQIAELMASRGYDREAAKAEMLQWVEVPEVRKYLM